MITSFIALISSSHDPCDSPNFSTTVRPNKANVNYAGTMVGNGGNGVNVNHGSNGTSNGTNGKVKVMPVEGQGQGQYIGEQMLAWENKSLHQC